MRTLNKRETLMRTQLKVIQDKQVVLCVMLAAIESSSNRPVRTYVDEYATEKIGNWTLFSSLMYFFG